MGFPSLAAGSPTQFLPPHRGAQSTKAGPDPPRLRSPRPSPRAAAARSQPPPRAEARLQPRRSPPQRPPRPAGTAPAALSRGLASPGPGPSRLCCRPGCAPLRTSASALVGSISSVPGAPSPPSGPSLCGTDKQRLLNQTSCPLLLRLLLAGRGLQPITTPPASWGRWAICAPIRQSSGERRALGAVTNQYSERLDWRGRRPVAKREALKMDGRRNH